jgi:RNA polymerase sigma-70 factor, ECF subfamily
MPLPSDRELAASAAKGQAAAFATLLGRYRDVRTRFAMRMLGDYDSADEALQAAFVRAFQSIGRCRDPQQFGDWLFRIVINECRARALRRAVRSRGTTGEVDAIADWRAAVEGSENAADVQRALDQIDPINREAFILQYIEELPYPQIALLTGASVVTLERQVDRACARLRELLPEWQKETPGTVPGLGASIGAVGPSFAVRIAIPLRRPEVLNDSFEDRLMGKLLRPGDVSQEVASPTVPAAQPKEPLMNDAPPPSPATLPDPPLFSGRFSLPLPRRFIQPAIALGVAAVAFGAGYALRGRADGRARTIASAKTKTTSARVVKRTDTLRVVKSDTVVVARFVFADPSAKSVALAGDFNRWDPTAASLTRLADGSWARTLRLAPGRYEYAFLVDGKRWVTDRFARSAHDAFDIESSVIASTPASASQSEDGSATSRLKKLLPSVTAGRVLATIATARAHGLPATALENRALKYAARHVSPKEIEQAIAADADAMEKSGELLTASAQRDASGAEIDAAAQLLGEGADSASIAALAKSAPANRSLEVPLRVSAELMATSSASHDALTRVAERMRAGASDAQLEHLLDEQPAVVASQPKAKKKETTVAKSSSSTDVRQAGTPAKSRTTTTNATTKARPKP